MKSLRRRDTRLPGEPRTVDTAAFDGCWVNTSARPQGLASFRVRTRDATPSLRSVDGAGGWIGWRTDSWRVFSNAPDSDVPTGFVARCRLAETEGLLQGGLNLGLLVLAVYREARPGRAGYFSREFFLRVAAPPEGVEAGPAPTLFPGVDEAAEIGLTPFCGRWSNTDPDSPGIARITIEDRGQADLRVEAASRLEGTEPDGWGAGETRTYATIDEAGVRTACVRTTYELGFMTAHLQLRVSGGALVLAGFTEFHDGSGRLPYFTREFYHRA